MKNFKGISLIVGVLTMSLFVNYIAFAWTEPSVSPPGGNVDTPLNTGTTAQTKNGDLSVTMLYDTNDNNYWVDPGNSSISALLAGSVGIGTTTAPNAALQVIGAISRQGTILDSSTTIAATEVNLGEDSTTNNSYSTISGGRNNTANGYSSSIGGGGNNISSGDYSVVSGGAWNTANGNYSIIAGGSNSTTTGQYSVVGGGYQNTASGAPNNGVWSVIGGGRNNTIGGGVSFIGGGDSNTISVGNAFIGGGYQNTIDTNSFSAIAGGSTNTASGSFSFIGAGNSNVASGEYSVVSGGGVNESGGDFSWAGGKYMQLTTAADNTFVWGHSGTPVSISTPDAFIIYSGNVGIGTTTPSVKLEVDGIIKTIPRSSATCDSNSEGGIYYDSDDNNFYGCNGSAWVQLNN